MVEFAVAASLFFMLLLGVAFWGMTMWQANTLQYAVERGARCAIISGCADSPDTFAAKQALGLSTDSIGGNANRYVLQSSGNRDGGTVFYTACVRTINKQEEGTTGMSGKYAVESISGEVKLLRILATFSAVKYCRPVQG